jgi:branched-chain amino acid transport system substrate-binding protein
MKKLLFTAISLCLGMVLLLSGNGFGETLAPYVVGFTLDLTGLRAAISIGYKRGAVIAIDEINAAGSVNGREMKAVFYDGESDPVNNVKNTKRIIDVDRAIACLGYPAVDATLASIDTATEAQILVFTGSPAIVFGRETKKWLFGTVPDQKLASVPLLVRNLLDRGCKKVAYIYIDTAYGMLGSAAFKWSCEKLGITPATIEKYVPGVVDVSPQLAHIKASGADGLLITGNLADTVKVIKTARELGSKYPIVCDYSILGPEFIELGGEVVEGIVSTTSKTVVAPDLPNTDIQKRVCMQFYNEYIKRHNAFTHYGTCTWDQVHLISMALRKVDPKLDPSKAEDLAKIRIQLRDNVEKIQGFPGQNGVFSYSPTNHVGLAEGCYVLVTVRNGKWRLYGATK